MTNALEIEERAARWLLRQETETWSESDQVELDQWLEASTDNKLAYWRLEYGWEKAGRLAVLREPGHALKIQPRSRTWPVVAIAASLAACLVVGIVSVNSGHLLEKAYKTDVGDHKTLALRDGTRVELNTATKLRADVTQKSRTVWLDEGEAYFEVAHDPVHPFVVHAGTRNVTVLGTKFSVRREGDRVEVAVIEGRVRVDEAQKAQPASAKIITRGDIVIAEGASTLLAVNSVDRVGASLGWRQGRLIFDQVTLADAAIEFNRYNRKKLIITDSETANIRIGGSFDAQNVDAFTRLLHQGFGLKIEDDGDNVKVSA